MLTAVTRGRSVSDEEHEAANAAAVEHFTASPTTNARAKDWAVLTMAKEIWE
jgi:hypothetical protein